MISAGFKYLSREDSDRVINSIQKQHHKVLALLMLDAGLRISEACTLRFRDFDFKKKLLKVRSLKKGNKGEYRIIPISNRLYRNLALHIEQVENIHGENPLFPGKNGREFISRQAVSLALSKIQKKANLPHFSPHSLRHTFATTHLANGTQLAEIKTMLGHKRFDTTLIYAQVPTEQLIERVNAVSSRPESRLKRVIKKLQPRKRAQLINVDFGNSDFSIGINKELQVLENNAQKGINTVVTGDIGVGKSHLLKSFETSKPILRLDDTESIKKSLAGILLYLYKNDKNEVLQLLWRDFDKPQIDKKIQRENTISLCDRIIEVTVPQHYILIIDDITKITPTAKKVVERFKDHFIIFCGARYVKANDVSFLWNFEKLEVKPLARHHAMALINQMSSGMEVESWDLFRNHIYNQTNGNPRAVSELVHRYRKEPFLTDEIVQEVKHLGALKEIDLTWIVVLFLGVVMALRYMAGELEEPALKFVGGIAMIALLMFRPLMRSLKRQFL